MKYLRTKLIVVCLLLVSLIIGMRSIKVPDETVTASVKKYDMVPTHIQTIFEDEDNIVFFPDMVEDTYSSGITISNFGIVIHYMYAHADRETQWGSWRVSSTATLFPKNESQTYILISEEAGCIGNVSPRELRCATFKDGVLELDFDVDAFDDGEGFVCTAIMKAAWLLVFDNDSIDGEIKNIKYNFYDVTPHDSIYE